MNRAIPIAILLACSLAAAAEETRTPVTEEITKAIAEEIMRPITEGAERRLEEAKQRRIESAQGKKLKRDCDDWTKAHEDLNVETTATGMKQYCDRYEHFIETGRILKAPSY